MFGCSTLVQHTWASSYLADIFSKLYILKKNISERYLLNVNGFLWFGRDGFVKEDVVLDVLVAILELT